MKASGKHLLTELCGYAHAVATHGQNKTLWKTSMHLREKAGAELFSCIGTERRQPDFLRKKSPANLLGIYEFGRWSK